MHMTAADTLHRLVKLALDSGEAADSEEAKSIFLQYRLRIHLGRGWADTLAGQAAFLTAVNTAARAFLGGVMVTGDVSFVLSVPLFQGRSAEEVAFELGGQVISDVPADVPTLVIGTWDGGEIPPFCIRLVYDGWQGGIVPALAASPLPGLADNPLAGVAAAALGVNEAFLHVRNELLVAGHREVGISLWKPAAIEDWTSPGYCGPDLDFLPASLWLVGLGHLGQAYAWALGMLPYPDSSRPYLVLQDFDSAAESNLSTCMFFTPSELGHRKTRVIAKRLELSGFKTDIVERRFVEGQRVNIGEPTTALFGVDNVIARRAIESAGFDMVVEAGLGSGFRDFRNIRTHAFPGPKRAIDIWSAADATQPATVLTPVYERLAEVTNDRCGVTQLASRAVATPFVGVLAASLVVAEVLRSLHGGPVYSATDLQMKEIRHRTIGQQIAERAPRIAFVPAANPLKGQEQRCA